MDIVPQQNESNQPPSDQKPLLIFNPNEYPFGPLSNNYKSFLRINNQLWSTVSHYIYANMVTDPVHKAMLRVAPVEADMKKTNMQDKVKQIVANIEARQGKSIVDPHELDRIYRAVERETTIRKMSLVQLYNYFLRLEYIQTVRSAIETGYSTLISQRPDLAQEILGTGTRQIIYRDSKDDLLGINDNNVGENIVGQTLMQIRARLQHDLEKEQKEKQANNKKEQIYVAYKAYMNLLFLLANGDTLKSLLKKTYVELARLETGAVINPDKNTIIELFSNNAMILDELQTPGSMVRRIYDENLVKLKNAINETRSYQIVQAYAEFIIRTKFPIMEPGKIEQSARQLQLSLDIENRKKEHAAEQRRVKRIELLNMELRRLSDQMDENPSAELKDRLDLIRKDIQLSSNIEANRFSLEVDIDGEEDTEQLKARRKELIAKLTSEKYRKQKRAEKRAEMEIELDIVSKRLKDAPISYEKFVNTIVSLYDTRQLPAEMTSYIQESLTKIPNEKDIESMRESADSVVGSTVDSVADTSIGSTESKEDVESTNSSSSASLYKDPLKRLLAGDEKTKKIDLIEQLQRYTGKSYQYYKDYTVEQLEKRLAERRRKGADAYKTGAGVWVLEVKYPVPGGVKTVVLNEYDEKPSSEETMSAISRYSAENGKDLSLSNASLYWKPKQIDRPEQLVEENNQIQSLDFSVYIVQYSSTLSPFLSHFEIEKIQFGSVFLFMCTVLLTYTGLSRNIKSMGNIFSRHRSFVDASKLIAGMTPAEAMSLYLKEKYNTHIEMLTTLAKVALSKKFERLEMRTLLSLTDNRQLIWNDRGDTWLGVPGNKVGEILTEIRSTVFVQKPISTRHRFSIQEMINDPFIFSWILQRAAEICRTVQMVRTSISPGMEIDEKLITNVFDSFYNQCKCAGTKIRTQAPEMFVSAIRECQPVSNSIKELAKKVFDMEISLTRENDDFYRLTGKSREALVEKIALGTFVQNQRDQFEKFINEGQVEEGDVQTFLKKQGRDFAVYAEDFASQEYGISLKDIDGIRLVQLPVSSKKRETYEEFARRHGVKLYEQDDVDDNAVIDNVDDNDVVDDNIDSMHGISLLQQIEVSQQPPSYDQMQAEQMRRFLLFLNTRQGQETIGERLEKLRNKNKNAAIDTAFARRWMIEHMTKKQQMDRDRYYGINFEEKTKEEVEQHERNIRDSLERIKQEKKRLKTIVEASALNEIECCRAYWTKITGILLFLQNNFGNLQLDALQNLIISSENVLSTNVKCSGEQTIELKDEFSHCIGTALTNVIVEIHRVKEMYESKDLTENDVDLAASIILGKVIKGDRITVQGEEEEINVEELFVNDGLVVESVDENVDRVGSDADDTVFGEDYGEDNDNNFSFPVKPDKKILKKAAHERKALLSSQRAKREALLSKRLLVEMNGNIVPLGRRVLSPINENRSIGTASGTSNEIDTVEVLTGPIPYIEEIHSTLNTISPSRNDNGRLSVYFYSMIKRIKKYKMDHEKKVNRINFFASIDTTM